MRPRRTLIVAATAALVATTVAPASAAPVTDFELPFPCTESWTGSTRDTHSPSVQSVDFNRRDDLGDPVVASAPGVVVTADANPDTGYGRWVVVDHGSSERSLYAHLNTVQVVSGQRVDQGQILGTLGSSGNSTGPHLHYEQRAGSTVTAPYFHQVPFAFGSTIASQNCADVPMAVDWNGDRISQVTVFRRTWPGQFHRREPDGSTSLVRFGNPSDQPLAGDWDGNGKAEVGVRRAETLTFYLATPGGTTSLRFGSPADQPIAGNWGGGPQWEVGVWQPNLRRFVLRMHDGTAVPVEMGDVDDLPVTGDWDGDGVTDLGVYDQARAVWTLRTKDAQGIVWTASVQFGQHGDLPAPGDWDGNGMTDLGVWTPSLARFSQRQAPDPTTGARRVTTLRFGARR